MGTISHLLTAVLGGAGGFVAAKRLAGSGHDAGSQPWKRQRAGDDAMAATGPVQRIVHIARIRSGNEASLRRLVEERFPVSAMAAPGLLELSTFVGSTYLLTEYAYSGEYTAVFNAYRNNPAVSTYLQELGELLDDEPAPQPDTPAQQFLATQALHWDRTEGLAFTPRVRPRDGGSATA